MSEQLPDALFGPLASRIAEASGIRIPTAKRWLLASRVAELQRAGQRFRNEVVVGPGGKQILLEDPDGNLIELFEPAAH